MAKLVGNLNFLIVSSDKTYIFPFNGDLDSSKVIDFRPHLRQKVNDTDIVFPECCELSPCENFVILTVQKELLFFCAKTTKLLEITNIKKTASRVRFFHKSERFLVADRKGCVWFYSYAGNTLSKESTHLGHNSLLTDALLSVNDDYVITCDRDEKIRVSHYPNVYNIQSYCLGHEEFVSSISLLPSDPTVLVSTSGDGTLRLWDFLTGQELLSFKQDTSDSFLKAVCCADGLNSLIAVSKYEGKNILLLSVTGDRKNGFQIIKKIEEDSLDVLLDFTALGSKIVVLTLMNDKPRLSQLCESSELPVLEKTGELLLGAKFVVRDTIEMLFKRRFDNVQEYHARKKARIEKKQIANVVL